MKCTIPEISWHNRDPVLSVDVQPLYNEEFYRLASGGTDCHILIWYLKIRENGAVDIDILSDLTRHQRAVNVVRWSPSGQYLASGDDDANIIIWNLKTDNIPLLEGETSDKEIWLVNKVLRGHKEDVYDICWAPNGMKLITGSIDNTAILWDFTKGQSECILSDHKGFVQGVSWDPKGQYIATLSSDRVCRLFDNTGKNVKRRAHKGTLPVPESHLLFNNEVKYFHDDTFKSYFRRLTFSPDGNLLVAPSGCIEVQEYKEARHATFIFTLDCFAQPVAMLPSPKQITIAVRCCPILFELHSEGTDPVIALPYRMIIAVATDSDVVLYDTQQLVPFAHLQKIHYTRITDLTWSSDGLLLIASSTDGFCTLITFEPDELGIQYVKEDSDPEVSIMDISGCEEIDKTESNKKKKEKEQSDAKAKKPNILEQWAVRKPKNELEDYNLQSTSKLEESGKSEIVEQIIQTASTNASVNNKDETVKPIVNKLIPKRIVPTKIENIQKPKKVDVNTTEDILTKSDMKKSSTSANDTVPQVSNCPESDDVIIVNDSPIKTSETSPPNKTNKANAKKRILIQESKKSHTPTKNNSLLKFFQVDPNTKKSTQNTPIDIKNEKENKANNQIVKESESTKIIEISEDETSIMDTISNELVPETDGKGISNQNLNLKDGSPACNEIKDVIEVADTSKSISNVANQSSSINKCDLTSEKSKTEIDLETKKTGSNEKSLMTDVHETCSSSNNTSVTKPATIKTPRRIPLVTLSSPKRKKKE